MGWRGIDEGVERKERERREEVVGILCFGTANWCLEGECKQHRRIHFVLC